MNFKRITSILLVLILQTGIVFAAQKQAAIPKDSCRNVAKRFEMLSNFKPSELAKEAPHTLDLLRRGETPNYYFICYNIYVENLFNQGRISDARKEIKKMVEEAVKIDDAECITVARRAEGQFYYKIGMYDRAATCFRKGMEVCPDYKELRSYFTYSSTATWLVKADLRVGKTEEAKLWTDRVGDMMKWLDQEGHADPTGHNQVMTLALKAQIAIARKDLAAAKVLLDSCKIFMQPKLPKRAYVEYYVAQMQADRCLAHRTKAAQLLDTLIAIHREDYRPISLEFMKQKADLLDEMNLHSEAATIYRDYISGQREVNDIAIAQQLDEMRTKYEVDTLKHEKEKAEHEKVFAIVVCFLLALLVIAITVYYIKMRGVNRVLMEHIRERQRETELKELQERAMKDKKEADLLKLGQQVMQCLISGRYFMQIDGGKKEVTEALKISERTMIQALSKATGMSFSNYVNKLRLEHSVELLEKEPGLSIAQVSEQCGFGTIRQYQRLFKTRYGISPSTFKSQAMR